MRESEAPGYTHNNTCILCHDYPGQTWVDDALIRINDDGLQAEVHWHCSLLQEAKEKEAQIQVLEDCVADITMEVHANMKRLACAQVVSRVEEYRGTTSHAVHTWCNTRLGVLPDLGEKGGVPWSLGEGGCTASVLCR